MHTTMLRYVLALLAGLALPAAGAAQQDTDDAEDADDRAGRAASSSPNVRLEIVDVSGNAREEVLRVTLPLAGDRPANVEARAGDASYDVSVRRPQARPARRRGGASGRQTAEDGAGDLLFVEIRRTHAASDGGRNVHLQAAVRIRRGTEAIVARLERPGGRRTEVVAALE